MTLPSHSVVPVILWGLMIMSPLPLIFFSWGFLDGNSSWLGKVIAGLTGWCIVQSMVAQLAAFTGHFNFRTILAIEAALFFGGILLLVILGKTGAHSQTLQVDFTRLTSLEIHLLGFAAVLFLFYTKNIIANPITEGDSLAYHLPSMAIWYQEGALRMQTQFVSTQFYPYGWELLCALFLFPFRGDFAITFPNLIALLILCFSIYGIGRRLGAQRVSALAMATLACSAPIIGRELNTMRVDIPLAAFFAASIFFSLLLSKKNLVVSTILVFCSAGMMIGVKSSGLTYLPLVSLVFYGLYIRRSLRPQQTAVTGKRVPWQATLTSMALAAVCISIVGGPWYIRNFVQTGNPIGIVQIALGEWVLFDGTLSLAGLRRTTLQAVFNPASREHWLILLNSLRNSLGIPAVGLLILLGVSAYVYVRDRLPPKRQSIGLVFILLIAVYLFASTPYSGDNGTHDWQLTTVWTSQAMRFALPAWGMLASVAAIAVSRANIAGEAILAVVAVSVTTVLSDGELAWWLLAGSALVLAQLWWRRHANDARLSLHVRAISLTVIVLGFLAVGLFGRHLRSARTAGAYANIQHAGAYEGFYTWYNQSVSGTDTVGYVLSHHSYLFYGESLDIPVRYIGDDSQSEEEFLRRIRSADISFLIIGPLLPHQHNAPELEWINNPQGFSQVFGADPHERVAVYRVKRQTEEDR